MFPAQVSRICGDALFQAFRRDARAEKGWLAYLSLSSAPANSDNIGQTARNKITPNRANSGP